MSADDCTYIKVESIPTASKFSEIFGHNARLKVPSNANLDFVHHNRVLKPLPEGVSASQARARVEQGAKRKKDASWGSHLMVNYPRGMMDQKLDRDIDAWADDTTEFLSKRYGERLVYGVLHRDELGPHLHYMLVPLCPKKRRVSQRSLFDLKETYRINQDYYDKVLKGHGINAPIVGSRPTHKDIRAFDKAVKAPVTLLNFSEEDVPEPPMIFTPGAKKEYVAKVASHMTALANDQNRPTATKANAVELFKTKNDDLGKLLRRKDNYIKELKTGHGKEVETLQQKLDHESHVADMYRHLMIENLDASEVLQKLGYIGSANGQTKEFQGVGRFQAVSVSGGTATTATSGGNQLSIHVLELMGAATGWPLAQCFAYLIEQFGSKAQATLVTYVERLAARARPNTQELNLTPSDDGWRAAMNNLPTGRVSATALELAHKQGKVVADVTGNISFLLKDASKQARGVIVYADSDMHAPSREYGGSSEVAFSMGLPGARNRVLCRDPWSVLQLYSSVPEASTFCFCGTSQQVPVAFMAALGAPKLSPLMRYGFSAGDPRTTRLEQQLGSTRFAEILECEPKALGYRLMTDPRKSKATGFGEEHGRVERDVDAPGEDMLP